MLRLCPTAGQPCQQRGVIPFLPPDTPVVTHDLAPVPAQDLLGKLGYPPITDATNGEDPLAQQEPAGGYTPATPTWHGAASPIGGAAGCR